MLAIAFPDILAIPRRLPPAPLADPCLSQDTAFIRRVVCASLRGYPRSEVDEIVQDVLIITWRSLGERWPQGRTRALMRDIALKRCANWRRKRREVLVSEAIEIQLIDDDAVQRQEAMQRRQQLVEIAQRVLSPRDQVVFRLRFIADLRPAEFVRRLPEPWACGQRELRVALQRIGRQIRAEIGRAEAAAIERLAGTARGG